MIRVLGDRVLVALPPKEHEQDVVTGFTFQQGETTPSGLVLAKPADVYNVELATRGIVMQVGEKRGQVALDDVRAEFNEFFLQREDCDAIGSIGEFKDVVDTLLRPMAPAPFDVQVGDCVLFSAAAGDQFSDDGIEYVVLHESEIIAVVAPLKEAVV